HLLEYARERVPRLDEELERLTSLLGTPPPLVDSAAFAEVELDRALAAIDAGSTGELEAALDELTEAHVPVHDAQADWCWALLTVLRDALGEDAMDEVFRVTQGTWVTERYASLAEMTPEESFQLTIEGMRGHRCGRGREGSIDVAEDD